MSYDKCVQNWHQNFNVSQKPYFISYGVEGQCPATRFVRDFATICHWFSLCHQADLNKCCHYCIKQECLNTHETISGNNGKANHSFKHHGSWIYFWFQSGGGRGCLGHMKGIEVFEWYWTVHIFHKEELFWTPIWKSICVWIL